MKSYLIGPENKKDNIRGALSYLIEYAKYLEVETGRSNPSYVDEIISDNNITVDVVEL